MSDILDGLTSYWRFNRAENTSTSDAFGSNDGTISGKTLNNATVNGDLVIKNGDMVFNGSNTSLTITNHSSIQITGDQTIAMWLYPTNISTDRQNPYNKAYGGEGTITQETSGKLNYYYGTSGSNTEPYQGYTSTGSVAENQWNHICVVRDLTNMKIYWYINGSLDSEHDADYAAATASTSDLLIGDGYTNHYYGRINNVLEYNTALSASQVKQLATQQPRNSYTPITDNLVLQLNGLDYAGTVDAPTTIYDSNFLEYTDIEGNSAMVFDGSDDYVNTGIATSLFANTGETWSVSAWFKTSGVTDGTIIGRSGGWGSSATFVLGIDSSGNLKTILRGSTSGTTTIASNVDDDEWHHVVVTWDGTTAYGYYDNGSAVTLNVDTAAEQSYDILIGATVSGSPNYFFSGKIDEVGLWSTALTSDEKSMIYQTSSHSAHQAYYKVTITDDDSVTHTICDTYSGTSANNYMINGSASRPLTNKLGDCSFRISNINGNFTGLFDGGEQIRIYADGIDATTLVWAGRVDNVRYGLAERYGYFVDIEGRTYPQLVDTLLSEVFASAKADYCLTKICSDYYTDLDFTFWEDGAWVGASYNSSTDSVDWDSTVTTFPTDLINTTYQHKKGIDAFTQVCEQTGLVYYIDYDSGWKLRVFLKDSIHYPFASITYGENLINVGGFGKANDDIFNRVTVYGEQESSNIIMVDTAEDSTNQSDLWVKHKVLKESSLSDMTDVEEKADYELDIATTGVTQEGSVDVIFMDSVKPGYTISANVLGCNLTGTYTIKNLDYDFGSSITLKMDLAKLPKRMADLFVPKVNPDDFLSGVNNPNDMLWGLTVSFDESPSLINCDDYSYEHDGQLRFAPYLPSSGDGTVTSDIVTADNNVTECEFRVYADYYTTDDDYQVTNDGGDNWEDYDLDGGVHEFSTTGNEVGFKIIPHRAEYETNWNISNIDEIAGNELDLSAEYSVSSFRFNATGSKLFTMGNNSATATDLYLKSYSLTSLYDISTASAERTYNLSDSDYETMHGFYMSPNGRYVFTTIPSKDKLCRMRLSSLWDFPFTTVDNLFTTSFSNQGELVSGATYDSDSGNFIAAGHSNIYIYNGVTSTLSSSFSAPTSNTAALAYDRANSNLISASDADTYKIYVHSGVTSTITNSFGTPGTSCCGLTFDYNNNNLISFDRTSDAVYVHSGVSATISSSFSYTETAGYIYGIEFNGTNLLIRKTSSLNTMIELDGISGTTLNSYDLSPLETGFELEYIAFCGRNMVVGNGDNNAWYVFETPFPEIELYDSYKTGPTGIWFNDSGTMCYELSGDENTVYQHSVSTPWDLSTKTYDNKSYAFDTSGSSHMWFNGGRTRFLTLNDYFISQLENISPNDISNTKSFGLNFQHTDNSALEMLDSLEHDANYGVCNSLVMIDSTHFMLAYTGADYDGYIKTFSIDGSYNITEIDSLEHDTSYGEDNSLVMIDSTHFMLAYRGVDDDGFIKTFSIDGSYNITEIDSLEHDTSNGEDNSLVMIDSTHFMLAYTGAVWAGFIKTFSIDGSYNITEMDSLEHDTNYGYYNSLIKIDSTHFMLAYLGGPNANGFIKTFSIDGSYNITEIDSLEHDTSQGYYNSLVMIDSTHFMLAYAGANNCGFIKTFSIDGSYNITEIDSLEHDTTRGSSNSLVMIDSTHFMLAYTGADYDGYIKTFSIDGSYNITEINSLEHDTTRGSSNSLVMIDSTHFMLAYAGADYDGYVKTIGLTSSIGYTTSSGTFVVDNGGDNLFIYNPDTEYIKTCKIHGTENRGGTYEAVCLLYK